jgi:hypothetical protein
MSKPNLKNLLVKWTEKFHDTDSMVVEAGT